MNLNKIEHFAKVSFTFMEISYELDDNCLCFAMSDLRRRIKKRNVYGGQALLVHDIVFNKFSCILSRISQSSIQCGKYFLFSHSLHGLLTR